MRKEHWKKGMGTTDHSERWTGVRMVPGSRLAGATLSGRRLWRNRVRTALIGAAVLFTLFPVVWVLVQIIISGGAAMSWSFLTESLPLSMRTEQGGFLNGLVGTAIMVGLGAAVAIPLGVLAAIYLVEYGKGNWLAKLIRFFSDVMTGVPSIFVGVFIYAALVLKYKYGALWGAASLAFIMLPIVVRSSEEMLKLVPTELKDASYALGAPRWKTVTKVVLPAAAPGLTTGAMLAVARAAGETAPLIMTVLGSIYMVTALTGEPISSLTLLIYNQSQQPFEPAVARAWAGALELLVIVLVFTTAARIMSSRSRLSQ